MATQYAQSGSSPNGTATYYGSGGGISERERETQINGARLQYLEKSGEIISTGDYVEVQELAREYTIFIETTKREKGTPTGKEIKTRLH